MENCLAECGVLTIATGSTEYKEMAKTLSRSLRRFSPGLKLAAVTDDAETLSGHFDYLVPVDWSRGVGVLQKLSIDLYSPFRCTLFIDCDCIVFRDVRYAFEVFSGGHSIMTTDVYELSRRKPREIDFTLMEQRTGQSWLYGFNGGAYYVERGTLSEKIFQQGRKIAKDFKEYGIPEFRIGEPNDEYVLAAAMAELRAPVVPCWHQLLQIPVGLESRFRIDVVSGTADFEIYGRNCRPAIVHFCGYFRNWPQYHRECVKLRAFEASNAARLSARAAELCFYLKHLGNAIYPLVPRPIRLAVHAISNRFLRRLR